MAKLMKCPNFNWCDTYVPAAERGKPHDYQKYDTYSDKMVTKKCPGRAEK